MMNNCTQDIGATTILVSILICQHGQIYRRGMFKSQSKLSDSNCTQTRESQ